MCPGTLLALAAELESDAKRARGIARAVLADQGMATAAIASAVASGEIIADALDKRAARYRRWAALAAKAAP